MKNFEICDILNPSRKGIVDVWNAFMVEGADFSTNNHDIPFSPTTATFLPETIIDWCEARELYNDAVARRDKNFYSNAFVCFFIDDKKFADDGSVSEKGNDIWRENKFVLKVLRHFAGAITPDFSLNQDFPYPIKIYNVYRARAFGYWLGKNGIAVINSVRWGTPETYDYMFDGLPTDDMLCIGTVGGSPFKLEDRERFEEGLRELVRRLHPRCIIVYGSANYPCFDALRESGIEVISYPSRTARVFEGRRDV